MRGTINKHAGFSRSGRKAVTKVHWTVGQWILGSLLFTVFLVLQKNLKSPVKAWVFRVNTYKFQEILGCFSSDKINVKFQNAPKFKFDHLCHARFLKDKKPPPSGPCNFKIYSPPETTAAVFSAEAASSSLFITNSKSLTVWTKKIQVYNLRIE